MFGVPMSHIKAREDFGRILARAGFTRPQLALAAGVSVRTVDALANPKAAGRQGSAREVTAWKIARGFAALTHQDEEKAFGLLFTEAEEESGPWVPALLAA